jgi:predicted nuclease of restriction endonuclease-like (RecB) superfamily
MENLLTNPDYRAWLTDLKARVRGSQIKAALRVNTELLSLYWELGEQIAEKQKTAAWGDKLLEQLSKDLAAEFPEMKGFSRRNLEYIRRWYLFYNQPITIAPQVVAQLEVVPQVVEQLSKKTPSQIVQQLVALIPWGHNREILDHCKTHEEALFYVTETLRNGWSRAVLGLQMESRLFERQGKAIHNFDLTLPKPQSDLARELLKDPYNFDFLTLGPNAHKRDIEAAPGRRWRQQTNFKSTNHCYAF